MEYHLKQVLNGKEKYYIKKIYHYDRNIGKTADLARLSAKYDIPIIVRTQVWKRLIEIDIPEKLPKYFKRNKPKAVVLTDSSSVLRYTTLLIEETLSDEDIKIVKRMALKGIV